MGSRTDAGVAEPVRARGGLRSGRRHRRGDITRCAKRSATTSSKGSSSRRSPPEAGAFTVADALEASPTSWCAAIPHVFQRGRPRSRPGIETARALRRAALQRWNSLKAQERAKDGRAHSAARRGAQEPARRCSARTRSASAPPQSGSTGNARGRRRARSRRKSRNSARRSPKRPHDPARAEEEMGDLLFAIANLSRKLGIEPEAALRKANDKFTRRFEAMEQAISASGRSMGEWASRTPRTGVGGEIKAIRWTCITLEPQRSQRPQRRYRTKRRRPFTNTGTLKFISRPTRQPLAFK